MTTQPAEVGIAPQPPLISVWGSLVEVGMKGGSVTFVSLADGTTSMYTSTGGGVLGGGAHRGPADASRQLLTEIEARLDLFLPADTCPLPGRDAVAFVVLTYEGIRRAESSIQYLEELTSPLNRLWIAANRVITAIRLASGDAPKKR